MSQFDFFEDLDGLWKASSVELSAFITGRALQIVHQNQTHKNTLVETIQDHDSVNKSEYLMLEAGFLQGPKCTRSNTITHTSTGGSMII